MYKNSYSVKTFGLCLFIVCVIFNLSGCKKPRDAAEEKKAEEIGGNPPSYCSGLANPCLDPACEPYSNCTTTASYAGVSVTYESTSGMLKFNSISDVNTVLSQLEVNNETYNANYDAQYPGYTVTQLDSMDDINSFDEFKKLKDFENLFPGFSSKRKLLENTENTWLASNFTGTDPDDLDFTFDDEENTICNSNNKFKVGTSVYEIKEDGLYINGVLAGGEVERTAGDAQTMRPLCFGSKNTAFFYPESYTRFKLKVAVHSIWFRSSAKGKVVSYKQKNNGNWKRNRTEMYVGAGGNIWTTQCAFNFTFNISKPTSGFEKRKSLKVVYRQWGAGGQTVYKTKENEMNSIFGLKDGRSYSLSL